MKTKTKSLTETTPRTELGFFDEMDRLFDSFMRRGWLHPFRDLWPDVTPLEEGVELRTPRVDVLNRDNELVVRAEIPGIKREDLKVEIDGHLLTIRGEHHEEKKTEEDELVRTEIARGTFSRMMTLPGGLDTEHAKAVLTDGLLEVHLPKTEKTERRRIEVD